MKCIICKMGETEARHVSVTLERGAMTLVFKSVPAQVCANCGEQYVDEQTTGRLLDQAEHAARNGVQIEVRTYIAA